MNGIGLTTLRAQGGLGKVSISVPVTCLGLARHFEAGYDAQTAAANRIIHIFQLDADTTVTLLPGVLLTKKSVQ